MLAGGTSSRSPAYVRPGRGHRHAHSPVAVAYAALERMTSGTWNLYLIAVHPAYQRWGIGAALIHDVEGVLAARGARVLLVETSGPPAFARSRAFYRANGYEEEARIRDFYAAGEDKVVFRNRKALAALGR
jgi:ribosomal protein S18 acetylase RimI-like enzyme